MAGLQHEPDRPQKTGAAALTVPGQDTLTSTGLGENISTHNIFLNTLM